MVAEVTTYHAQVDRDGSVWRVRVPEVQRTTQARNLREVEAMARDLIAIMDDIPADSFSLEVAITLPAEVQEELDRSAALRQEAARSQAAAAAAARRAARRLRDQGLPLQDVGPGARGVIPAGQAAHRRSRPARQLTADTPDKPPREATKTRRPSTPPHPAQRLELLPVHRVAGNPDARGPAQPIAASHSDSHQRQQPGHNRPCPQREAAGRHPAGHCPEPASNRLIVPDTEEATSSNLVPPTKFLLVKPIVSTKYAIAKVIAN